MSASIIAQDAQSGATRSSAARILQNGSSGRPGRPWTEEARRANFKTVAYRPYGLRRVTYRRAMRQPVARTFLLPALDGGDRRQKPLSVELMDEDLLIEARCLRWYVYVGGRGRSPTRRADVVVVACVTCYGYG